MEVYASEENLRIVRQAITELVQGKRQVKVEYATKDGYKNSFEYTSVSLRELRQLESEMMQALNPQPLMQCVEVEVLF